MVHQDGGEKPILDPSLNPPLKAPQMERDRDDDEKCEYLVGVRWLKAVPKEQAYWESDAGLLTIPSTVARLRKNKALETLRAYFGLVEVSDENDKRDAER